MSRRRPGQGPSESSILQSTMRSKDAPRGGGPGMVDEFDCAQGAELGNGTTDMEESRIFRLKPGRTGKISRR